MQMFIKSCSELKISGGQISGINDYYAAVKIVLFTNIESKSSAVYNVHGIMVTRHLSLCSNKTTV